MITHRVALEEFPQLYAAFDRRQDGVGESVHRGKVLESAE
jgi:hypothetical protein